jgi:hypothetical protein
MIRSDVPAGVGFDLEEKPGVSCDRTTLVN